MQRITEQLQLRSDALEARMRRFNVILFKVRRATRLERVAAHAVQDGFYGPMHIPFMIDSLEALARVGATLKWPIEEVVLLNLPSQQLLDAIEGRLLGALAMLDFMRPFGKNDTEQFRRQFNAVVGACLAVKKYAEPLSSRLEARLEELRKEMLEVQAKLAVLNPIVRHD